MIMKAMTGLFASALLLSVTPATAQACTPGDTRPCTRDPGSYPDCYQECTSFGNWTTTCFCFSPTAPKLDQQSSTQETSSEEGASQRCAEMKPAPKQAKAETL